MKGKKGLGRAFQVLEECGNKVKLEITAREKLYT